MSELEGIPGASPTLQKFVSLVRLYHRDFPELNRLVAGEESSPRQVAWAALDALADFNGTPHITYYSLEQMLGMQQQALMLRLTTISLLESVALLQTRNHIGYSSGGTTVGVNDKAPLIRSWLEYFSAKSEQMKQRVKVALNIGGMLGTNPSGLHSEYWAINATYVAY